MLTNKKILLGVTGSISAYKICTVIRLLKKSGASVKVLMTQSATQFITPLTFSTLSEEEVIVSQWPTDTNSSTNLGVQHIHNGIWADAMLIAPATANTIAHLAYGIAEDVVSSTALSLRCPLIICPAMDVDMYEHSATQENITTLQSRGCFILPPETGELASGLVGAGRLPEPEKIVDYVNSIIEKTPQQFSGKKILISAGPTYEPIDPVRFIGNHSSGKMGFALANSAALQGAEVTLVSGPVTLKTPRNVNRIDIETAEQMKNEMLANTSSADIIIMSAAVADFTLKNPHSQKLKKSTQEVSLQLTPTIDILQELGKQKSKKQFLVGFALETENEIAYAQEKLRKKNLDMIVVNNAKEHGAGFRTETNKVTIIIKDGNVTSLPLLSKFDVAVKILEMIKQIIQN